MKHNLSFMVKLCSNHRLKIISYKSPKKAREKTIGYKTKAENEFNDLEIKVNGIHFKLRLMDPTLFKAAFNRGPVFINKLKCNCL